MASLATKSQPAVKEEDASRDSEPGSGAPADVPRMDAFFGLLGLAVYMTDREGRLTYHNGAAAELWGRCPRLGEQRWCGSWRLQWPDGREMPHETSPTAVALSERRALRGAEAVAIRPDGARVAFLAYPAPVFDEAGTLVGAVSVLVDIGEHKRSKELAQRFASIVATSRDAILSKDLNGVIQSWNAGAERLFGYAADEAVGKSVTILIPPGRHDEEPEILERIRKGERIEHYTTVRQRKDGSLVDVSLSVSPVADGDGHVVGASSIARDITDYMRAQERQALLLREMNHRVKNVFAMASSLVSLCARTADTPSKLAETVRDKLGALARAHQLTLPGQTEMAESGGTNTNLRSLLETVVSPFVDANEADRLVFEGPLVEIGNGATTSVALLLHELATNAAKHGSLSVHEGRVEVRWILDHGILHTEWAETGGPKVIEPQGDQGFGDVLARGTVERQLKGEIVREWRPEGLVVRLSIPEDRIR